MLFRCSSSMCRLQCHGYSLEEAEKKNDLMPNRRKEKSEKLVLFHSLFLDLLDHPALELADQVLCAERQRRMLVWFEEKRKRQTILKSETMDNDSDKYKMQRFSQTL